MIAQCPSCSARFRVADDKVPDKGVKVRCTKCATVFKVTRADAAPAPAPAQDDLGLGFNAPAPPPAPPAAPNSARRSQSFDIGESTSPVPLPTAGSYGNLGASHVPAAHPGTAVSLPYGAASPQNSLDLDLSLGPPPPAPAPPARPAMPGGGFRPVPPSAANASLNAIDAALDAAMASSSSGGFDLGLADDAPPPPPPARPPPQRAPQARPAAPLPAAAVDPFASLSLDGGSDNDPFADLGPPPPPPPPPPARAPPRPPAKAPPARPAAPPPSDLGASDPFAVEPNFDESPGLELNALPAFSPAPAPVRTPSAPEPSNPFSGLDTGPSAQAPAPTTPPAAAPAAETPSGPEESAAAPPAGGPVRGANNEFDFGSDDAAPPPAVADDRAPLPADLAKIQLSRKDGGDRSTPSTVDATTLARSLQRADYWAALFNVVSAFIVGVAAIISVALIRSPRPLTSDDFGFPLVWIALGLDTGDGDHLVRTLRVTTTAYPTRAGADLFVVRGDVENSGDARRGAVTVVVELLHSGTLVGRAESVAGLGAGPEEIFLQDARRNDELQLSLARTATTVDLGANATLPFVAIFPVSAADAAGCVVRLNVVDGIPAGMEGAFAAGVLPSARKPASDAAPQDPSPAVTSTDAGTAPPDAGEASPAEGTR